MDLYIGINLKYLNLFFEGLQMTILLVIPTVIISLILGIPIALARTSKNPRIWGLPWAYIYFFRGTPLLVQLFMIYYGLGQFQPLLEEAGLWQIFKPAYSCCLIAFSLNSSAYIAEIFRGAIENTDSGEIEAAKAYGMSKVTMYRRIILPSAFRRALPAYGNEVIFTLHGSALASTVTVVDLLGAGRIVISETFAAWESFITVGLIYLCITYLITRLFKWWENNWHAHLQ